MSAVFLDLPPPPKLMNRLDQIPRQVNMEEILTIVKVEEICMLHLKRKQFRPISKLSHFAEVKF